MGAPDHNNDYKHEPDPYDWYDVVVAAPLTLYDPDQREDPPRARGSCGDGVDNGGDTLMDAADPDCHVVVDDMIFISPIPAVIKDTRPDIPGAQDIANLWLCKAPSPTCQGPGEGKLVLDELAAVPATTPGGLGAFELQLKYDHKVFDIEIEEGPFLGSTGRPTNCSMSILTENDIRFGCVSWDPTPGDGDIPPGPTGGGVLALIKVLPESDLVYRLTPGQNNGVVRTLLDENCELADIYGDPLPGTLPGGLLEVCNDATITVRILEGDLNLDCVVNVLDQQMIAFRYGASFGGLLYDPWYDLEPALKDFDIDIKDLQKVFGRNGSTCQAPIPDQPPMPPPP